MKPFVAMSVLFLGLAAFAAEPHVSQVLSSRQARLGEPIELTVTVRHPPGETWTLQVPDALGAVSVLGQRTESRMDRGEQVDVITTRFGVYELGKQLLPELSLREQHSGAVKPLERDTEVEIVSALAPDAPRELRDVAPAPARASVGSAQGRRRRSSRALALAGLGVMARARGRGGCGPASTRPRPRSSEIAACSPSSTPSTTRPSSRRSTASSGAAWCAGTAWPRSSTPPRRFVRALQAQAARRRERRRAGRRDARDRAGALRPPPHLG